MPTRPTVARARTMGACFALAVALALGAWLPGGAAAQVATPPAVDAADCAGAGAWMADTLRLVWFERPDVAGVAGVLAAYPDVPPDGPDRLRDAARDLSRRAARFEGRAVPAAAVALNRQFAEHDRIQADGFARFARYIETGDERLAQAGADRASEAKRLGQDGFLAMQALADACGVAADPEMAPVVGCVDALAALSSEWMETVMVGVSFAGVAALWPLDPERGESAAETLPLVEKSRDAYARLRVPRGAEGVDRIVAAFYRSALAALRGAAVGDPGQLEAFAQQADALFDQLTAERSRMFDEPCGEAAAL